MNVKPKKRKHNHKHKGASWRNDSEWKEQSLKRKNYRRAKK